MNTCTLIHNIPLFELNLFENEASSKKILFYNTPHFFIRIIISIRFIYQPDFSLTITCINMMLKKHGQKGNRIERTLVNAERGSGKGQKEGELDKRISMVVKVINSQVWPSYCPALYPPTV